MCGIVGYIGNRQAFPLLMNGLKRLEYRGYDSAGVALLNNDLRIFKCKGRVIDLENLVKNEDTTGCIGMAHTRWATHGEPSDVNSHPHSSFHNHFVLIHNGIIENYSEIKKYLIGKGYEFKSETDTEVLVNLIEYFYLKGDMAPEDAVRLALRKVDGAYGLVIAIKDNPNMLIAARKSSPLVIGVGKEEYFIASDATPIIEHTKSVIYLENNDIAILKQNELVLTSVANANVIPQIKEIDLDLGAIEKGGYDHFMLKEIFEQPRSIFDTFRGRISSNRNEIRLGGLLDVMPKILQAKRIIIIGCGTSWHAGLVGEYLFEELARIPVEVEYASEFRYREPVIFPEDVVIAISQSGETADTLAGITLAKQAGALVLGICNVVGSSIPRLTDAGVYTHAGPEIGVASTKAFTAQVTVLAMMAIVIGSKRGVLSDERYTNYIKELTALPERIDTILKSNDLLKDLAHLFQNATNCLYLGRGVNFPVALEGALKLKEISYIHAEGYPAAEMKHGPIALIDENMPVVFIALKDKTYDKIVSNIQEVKARKGIVIAVVTQGDSHIQSMVDHIIIIPDSDPVFSPLLAAVPLQLLSYHIAVQRGCDVDQPRNLAKSVTVE